MRPEAFRTAAVALIAVTALSLTTAGERLELYGQDVRFALRGPRPPRRPETRIVLVTIGPEAIERWKDTPLLFWGSHYAEAIRTARAAGAAAIGLDIIPERDADAFLEEKGATGSDVTPDADLERAIREARGIVCLAYAAEPPAVVPSPRFWENDDLRGRFGFVDLPVAEDGVVRQAWVGWPSDPARLSLPALLVNVATGTTRSFPNGASPFLLDSVTPPPRLPILRLAPGDGAAPGSALTDSDRQLLRGAVVLIGFTDPAMKDTFALTGFRHTVPGLEVLAAAYVTLREERAPRRVSRGAEALLIGTLGLASLGLVGAAGRRRRPGGASGLGMGAALFLAAAYAGGTQWLFTVSGWLLPAVLPLAAMLTGGGTLLAASGRAEAAERQKIERLFGRYLAPEVRDHLMARPENQRLGGESREATILFFDIRDSAKQAEGAAPSAVLEELNAYLGVVIPAVEKEGGFINTFLGDGFLALFGVPDTGQTKDTLPAVRAVRAARGIIAATEKINHLRASEKKPLWRFGCGVHTGIVVAGSMGDKRRAAYTVLGDPVNLASRLEGLSKDLGATLVLSDSVYDRLPDAGPERNRLAGPVARTVRGRDTPVLVYWLPITDEIGQKESKSNREANHA